jgi:hypothetical protein
MVCVNDFEFGARGDLTGLGNGFISFPIDGHITAGREDCGGKGGFAKADSSG